jgi:hypothetical protein
MNAPRARLPRTANRLVLANPSRRRFLQGVSTLGGLVLAAGYPSTLRAADPPKYGAHGMPNGWVDDPLVFVAIGEDGTHGVKQLRVPWAGPGSQFTALFERLAIDLLRECSTTGAVGLLRVTGTRAGGSRHARSSGGWPAAVRRSLAALGSTRRPLPSGIGI